MDLAVQGAPDDWTARLRGGGMQVTTVFVDRTPLLRPAIEGAAVGVVQ